MKNNKPYKLWGSAFKNSPNDLMIEFTVGHDVYPIIAADEILIPYDIKCNKAHVKMLGKQGLINKEEMTELLKALEELYTSYIKGDFVLDPILEDVHTNIENWIAKKYSPEIAGKIHTARSRNDQIVTDMYLYLHDEIDKYIGSIGYLITSLDKSAEKYIYTLCPGFTHHQHATITSFGMILDSFKCAFERDIEGLKALKKKYDHSPLGACVAYGTLINIDPEYSAKELGFKGVFKNSIDVISNRGEFETAFAFVLAQFLNHASNLAQTLILFSTTEFGFVKLDDKYSTGSSAMPQKKNPDPLELIKAVAGTASGVVTSLLGITKNNMIGYNRDNQETKYHIYHLILKTSPIPYILKGIIDSLKVNEDVMKEQANKGFINSMGLMELIIMKFKLPMRSVKVLVEKSIKDSILNGEQNKVKYSSFTKIVKEMGLKIDIEEKKFEKWQDGKFQLLKLQKSHEN